VVQNHYQFLQRRTDDIPDECEDVGHSLRHRFYTDSILNVTVNKYKQHVEGHVMPNEDEYQKFVQFGVS